jgi:hypothetical protein
MNVRFRPDAVAVILTAVDVRTGADTVAVVLPPKMFGFVLSPPEQSMPLKMFGRQEPAAADPASERETTRAMVAIQNIMGGRLRAGRAWTK